jgi:hypothetical protein
MENYMTRIGVYYGTTCTLIGGLHWRCHGGVERRRGLLQPHSCISDSLLRPHASNNTTGLFNLLTVPAERGTLPERGETRRFTSCHVISFVPNS